MSKAPAKGKFAYSSRRPRGTRYEVKHLPPPWKRSLTESGMTRRTTPFEIAVVATFVVAVLAILAWILVVGYPG